MGLFFPNLFEKIPVFAFRSRYQTGRKFSFSSVFYVKITDNREYCGSDKIHKQICHRIDKSDIQIAAIRKLFIVCNAVSQCGNLV